MFANLEYRTQLRILLSERSGSWDHQNSVLVSCTEGSLRAVQPRQCGLHVCRWSCLPSSESSGEEEVSRGTMKEKDGVVLLSSTINAVCISSGKAVFFSPILADCLPAGSLLNQIPGGMQEFVMQLHPQVLLSCACASVMPAFSLVLRLLGSEMVILSSHSRVTDWMAGANIDM